MGKIEKSQVAMGGSTISNSMNTGNIKNAKINSNVELKKIKRKNLLIGFVLGILSSIVSSYIYDHYIK